MNLQPKNSNVKRSRTLLVTYDMMSDGFKAMINICAEIAYRCIQPNGFIGGNGQKYSWYRYD